MQMSFKWYVLQVHSSKEKLVKQMLEKRVKDDRLEHKVGEILVPTENIVELRSGQKRKSERRFYPGYVLLEIDMDDAIWHLIRSIPKVSGFIGGDTPTPLTDEEANKMISQVEESVENVKPKTLFENGEVVRVIDGPFADFSAVVEDVNYEKNRLKVSVLIFGRSTPVELDFSQVEKG
tara:strand:- start:47575 stop:48108 length:534 start_codon:yes stop_codon:yes gene_type:complete